MIDGEPFFRVDMPELATRSDVAGVTVDASGQVYFADALRIQICEQNGRCMQILSKPENGVLRGSELALRNRRGQAVPAASEAEGSDSLGPREAARPPL